MRLLPLMLIFIVMVSFNSLAQSSECDYSVEILLDDNEFESKDFTWRMKATKIEGQETAITGTAKIEDKNGKTAKSYNPWSSDSISRQKTSSKYTPNLKPGDYEIIAEIKVQCDDKDEGNNVDRKSITIRGNAVEEENKNEDAPEKEDAIEDTVPNEIKRPITIASPKPILQPAADNTIQLNLNGKNKDQQVKLQGDSIKSGEIAFESSSEKAKGLVMISLLALSILLNVVLIWKR